MKKSCMSVLNNNNNPSLVKIFSAPHVMAMDPVIAEVLSSGQSGRLISTSITEVFSWLAWLQRQR